VSSVLPFVIAGLVSGSVYGLAGIGLVLTYKTSGIFNFAHGALVTIAAYLFYTLFQQDGVAWALSAAICVPALGIGMGLVFELFARRMALTPVAQRIAGTVGAVILVQAGATLIYGVDPLQVQVFLPHQSFDLAGVAVTVDQVIIVATGIVVTAALYVLLRSTRLGTAMRAVVDNPDLLSLSQYNTNSIRRYAWIIGCTLAALSGVLIVPSLPLTPSQLTLLIVQAFGAAAIGRFVSLPFTYAGGLAIGVASSLCTKFVGNNQILAGLPSSIPFIVLFLVLVVAPKGTWRSSAIAAGARAQAASFVSSASARVQTLTAVPALALAVIAPLIVGTHLIVWGSALTFVILFASMALLIRVAGQISLCHVAFAAIGASTFARLAGEFGIPWFLALALASLVVVPVAAILAVPASRLPVLYLGLATLGFGVLLQQMFYSTSLMFSPYAAGLNVPRPHIAGTDTQYYYLILAFAVVSVSLIIVMTQTRLGRVLRGLADSPLALKTLGADERITRTLVFCLSAFFAGLSGALYAGLIGNVDPATFDPLASLTYLVLIVIAVGGPLWASIAAAIGFAVIPGYVQNGNVTQYLQVAFGLIAIAVAAGLGQPAVPRRLERLLSRRPAQASRPAPPAAEPAAAGRGGGDLEIREMSVSFGGIRAVRNLSISARHGLITGLIGPNGAGKTTTFNVCSGLIKPTAGHVLFDGHDVTSAGTSRRARLGIGRTFQQPELFPSMTVLENVALGSEASIAGANPWSQVVTKRHDAARDGSAAWSAIDVCGLQDILSVPAHALSTGQRRLVEIARCLAGPARLLLLDEPSAGLDSAETARLAEILRRLKAERGLGILLVEHDMELVMNVCDYIHVMDFGQQIFAGEPADVQASDVVQAAYLGEPAQELDLPAEPAPTDEPAVKS
jgi:ABC-type branched-subunit amino acid transport system ATPase component/branched-subunit amino acid ABC-type transport system permease component